jgi:hypothetical protein
MSNRKDIESRRMDLDPRRRPGIPMEQPPHPRPGAQMPIEQQQSAYPVLKHGGRRELPPVYGTAVPPRGLSGVLRKLAYHYPDHLVRHWMVLMVADRVDSLEYRLRRMLPLAAVLLVGGLTVKLLRR